MGLHDFLTDRIAEEEREAERANSWAGADAYRRDNYGYLSVQTDRVLAEVGSKRAILELHRDLGADFYSPDHPDADTDGVVRPNGTRECAECHHAEWPCATVRHLAAVYADHADYDPEWEPQQ